jgi:hypothetical protein
VGIVDQSQMYISYYNLLILIYFCSFSWTFTIKNDGAWPWTKTKYLTRSNWSSLLSPNENQHSVWFLFHYLNYCGYCKKAEPGWEAIARYAISKKIIFKIIFYLFLILDWSKYIQIGAYDCASETVSTNDICQDARYPQWRIYCPLTNSTYLAFHSSQRTDETKTEDILKWSLQKLNEIVDQCYGKAWPVQSIIQPKSKDDLDKIIPKNINQFQLFVSNDILQYTIVNFKYFLFIY